MSWDTASITADLRDVALLAGQPDQLDALLGTALEALAEIIPYDLAAVLGIEDGALVVRSARGPLADARVRAHRIDLAASPQLAAVLRGRRPKAFTEADHDAAQGGEHDPYEGVVELPSGHACLVVPLHVSGRVLGAITFDRTVCELYDQATLDLATVYGQVVALAMALGEANDSLARSNQRLEERARAIEHESAPADAAAWITRTRAPAMAAAVELIRRVAPTPRAVLITGETGTGKEVAARALHAWSDRAAKPFLKLNCSALPEHLVESELFGHVRGAFSGADRDRPGRFLAADGGTLLLDEIGDLPPGAQAKLLRVLQEGAFEQVGSDRTVHVDVRIVAATHLDLEAAIAAKRFRADLYYRLAVFPVRLPALRERREDILLLAEGILARLSANGRHGPWTLSAEAQARMLDYAWPGNVRELQHSLERATILHPRGAIPASALPAAGSAAVLAAAPDADAPLDAIQREAIRRALDASGGRVYGPEGAAARLGLKPSTLQHRMKKLGIAK